MNDHGYSSCPERVCHCDHCDAPDPVDMVATYKIVLHVTADIEAFDDEHAEQVIKEELTTDPNIWGEGMPHGHRVDDVEIHVSWVEPETPEEGYEND